MKTSHNDEGVIGLIKDIFTAVFRPPYQIIRRDFMRLFWPSLIAYVCITHGVDLAVAMGQPAMAPWGTFTGAAFMVSVIVHILRRLMFPKIDMGDFADHARYSGTGAGLVFLGMCLVISAMTLMAGSMLRT